MRFRGAAGSFTPIRGWRHNGDPRLAPLRRSSAGAYKPILPWLLYADHRLAPMRRSLTVAVTDNTSAFATHCSPPRAAETGQSSKELPTPPNGVGSSAVQAYLQFALRLNTVRGSTANVHVR